MKNLFALFGLDDGQGSISFTRVFAMLLTACYLASKFYNAHLTHTAITWDNSDLAFIGTIGGMLIVKSHVENQQPSTPPKA